MKPEYYEIYQEMLDEPMFRRRAFPYFFSRIDNESLRLIESAVEEACEKNKVVLRPDAKFFLVSNFHQMVAVPVTIVRGRQARGEIAGLIREDANLIVSAAAEGPKDEGQVTGGAILRTTAQLWDRLKTNAENIWT